MLTEEDIAKLRMAKNLILEVRDNIDCNYCRKHVDITLDMISDMMDITRLNLLYNDDPASLDKLREMIQSESMLRILAMGSRVMGLSRRLRHIRRRRVNRNTR